MYVGAFVGFLVAFRSGSPWLGLLTAVLAGVLTGALMGLLTVTWGLNQHVSGLGITLLLIASCEFSFRVMFTGERPALDDKFHVWFRGHRGHLRRLRCRRRSLPLARRGSIRVALRRASRAAADLLGSQRTVPARGRRRLLLAVSRSGRRALVSVGDGPGLKGAGAAAFLIDYVVRHSPRVVPALRRERRRPRDVAARSPRARRNRVKYTGTPARRDERERRQPSDRYAGSRQNAFADHHRAGDDEDRRRPRIAERGERPRRAGRRGGAARTAR